MKADSERETSFTNTMSTLTDNDSRANTSVEASSFSQKSSKGSRARGSRSGAVKVALVDKGIQDQSSNHRNKIKEQQDKNKARQKRYRDATTLEKLKEEAKKNKAEIKKEKAVVQKEKAVVQKEIQAAKKDAQTAKKNEDAVKTELELEKRRRQKLEVENKKMQQEIALMRAKPVVVKSTSVEIADVELAQQPKRASRRCHGLQTELPMVEHPEKLLQATARVKKASAATEQGMHFRSF